MPQTRTLLHRTDTLMVERVVSHVELAPWSPGYNVATPRKEIPFRHSLLLAQAALNAPFHTTSGWGHPRLLGSPAVIEQVMCFVC